MKNFEDRENKTADMTQNTKLPSELLIKIFRFHVQNLPPLPTESPGQAPIPYTPISPKEWLWFTHVCRFWRDVALECPHLWSTPDFRFPTIAIEMLKRTKKLPITLKMDVSEAESSSKIIDFTVQVLNEHLSHTDSLELTIPYASAMQCVLEAAFNPTNSLHELSLHVGFGGDESPLSFSEEFVENTPHLHRIALDGCYPSWNSPLLKNLTHFSVTFDNRFVGNLPFSRLAGILRHCPDLEELELLGCLSTDPRSPTNVPPIDLPRLRQLMLITTISAGLQVITALQLPMSTCIHLGCQLEPSFTGRTLQDAITRIITRSLGSSPATAKEISILELNFIYKVQNLHCTAWDSPPPGSGRQYQRLFDLDLFVPEDMDIPDDQEYTEWVLEAVPRTSIRALRINDLVVSPHIVSRVIGSMPKLRLIDLTGEIIAAPFIAVLGEELKDRAEEKKMAFPALESLYIAKEAFGPHRPGIEMKAALFTHLALRRDRGFGIKSLTLRGCLGILKTDVPKLRELVSEVTVR
ncbi:hypothetical protein V5O48_006497 [Marasmius crinis-equi]|uniref:F-box domain-containing protein n=1 Tax=Marasmius crinis-equi TaxID=585013 RepID=A0ABR3FJC3_9AGAR